jgi:hypothetical protein
VISAIPVPIYLIFAVLMGWPAMNVIFRLLRKHIL